MQFKRCVFGRTFTANGSWHTGCRIPPLTRWMGAGCGRFPSQVPSASGLAIIPAAVTPISLWHLLIATQCVDRIGGERRRASLQYQTFTALLDYSGETDRLLHCFRRPTRHTYGIRTEFVMRTYAAGPGASNASAICAIGTRTTAERGFLCARDNRGARRNEHYPSHGSNLTVSHNAFGLICSSFGLTIGSGRNTMTANSAPAKALFGDCMNRAKRRTLPRKWLPSARLLRMGVVIRRKPWVCTQEEKHGRKGYCFNGPLDAARRIRGDV